MIFIPSEIPGAFIVELRRLEDHRGFFARSWCEEEFAENGLDSKLVQCSISFNEKRGTLRGMHYQATPYEDVKLVRCTMGSIYDVIVDLRPTSPTFMRHLGVELSAVDRKMLYIPKGCAHGFQTLEDRTEVFYQMSQRYVPGAGRGVRWNDPAFGIAWPFDNPIMLERDRNYADFRPEHVSAP
jgi:dTDP-4-dehydrorhamnose 3,5-epimerase